MYVQKNMNVCTYEAFAGGLPYLSLILVHIEVLDLKQHMCKSI